MVNIIVVFPKMQDAASIRNLLLKHGYTSVFACNSGAKAISLCNEDGDGIIISGYRLADMMYSEILDYMPSGYEMLLMASERSLSQEREENIVCLSMPMKVHHLLDTLAMMAEGVLNRRRKRKSQPKVRSDEQKELIREAKALLMERNHMTEEEAHRYIQKCSMDSATNMVETAQMILTMMRD